LLIVQAIRCSFVYKIMDTWFYKLLNIFPKRVLLSGRPFCFGGVLNVPTLRSPFPRCAASGSLSTAAYARWDGVRNPESPRTSNVGAEGGGEVLSPFALLWSVSPWERGGGAVVEKRQRAAGEFQGPSRRPMWLRTVDSGRFCSAFQDFGHKGVTRTSCGRSTFPAVQ
jgi:hypothetical protein